MAKTARTTGIKAPLSTEAADELVRYLHLLIDQIQFSCYAEQFEKELAEEKTAETQPSLWEEFE